MLAPVIVMTISGMVLLTTHLVPHPLVEEIMFLHQLLPLDDNDPLTVLSN